MTTIRKLKEHGTETYSGTNKLSLRLHELDVRLNAEAEAVQGLIAQNQNDYNSAYEAAVSRFTAAPIAEQKKRRVAACTRVSTDSDEQFTSYEAQID